LRRRRTGEKFEALVRMLESQKPQTAKILIKVAGRLFLADPKDVCYATIDDGVITVTTSGHLGMEGQSNCGRWKSFLRTSIPTCSGGRTGRFWSTRITSRGCALVQKLLSVAHGR